MIKCGCIVYYICRQHRLNCRQNGRIEVDEIHGWPNIESFNLNKAMPLVVVRVAHPMDAIVMAEGGRATTFDRPSKQSMILGNDININGKVLRRMAIIYSEPPATMDDIHIKFYGTDDEVRS